MKRRSRVVVVIAITIALVLMALWWKVRELGPAAPALHHAAGHADESAMARAARGDPRGLPRGSISGTVTDEGKQPIAHAQVCTSAVGLALPSASTRGLACAFTDDRGHYKIGELIAAGYLLHASARQFRPGAFRPRPGMDDHEFSLAAGEAKTGVDVELMRGGAEITGVVVDALGGPIPHAEVRDATRGAEHAGAAADTDEQGRFSLCTDRGDVTLSAIADGYAPATESRSAPGRVEIILMPESSLAGQVVDGVTAQPVVGAQVELDVGRYETPAARDITDAQGKFRLEHLRPGRYTAAARTEHGYGRTAGSLRVGLAQQVEGTVIQLFPAHRVAGRVVIASSHKDCVWGTVELIDHPHDRAVTLRTAPDGLRIADGVASGTYTASVRCGAHVTRDGYDPIVVGDLDVTGVVWEVDDGARIRGKVLSTSGAALGGVALESTSIGAPRARTAWGFARSKADGSFELSGLRAGSHRIAVTSEHGVAPVGGFEVSVAPAATLEHDFVLDDSGALIGSAVDDTGAAVRDAHILVIPSKGGIDSESSTSDADGAFAFHALRPGDYRVAAYRDVPRHRGDPQPTVTVQAGQTATVKLTLESQGGMILGTVVDAASQPVPDAFLSWARDLELPGAPRSDIASTREDWRFDVRPVLTGADGRFQITGLADGTYTLRAHRKGGGEGIAEHVAVGATARLQIKPTGSIAGVARRKGASPPHDLKVALQDGRTGLARTESFYMTGGRFVVTDLPAGHFEMVVDGDRSQNTITVDLLEGETRTGVDVELTPLVTVTGRLVEHGTRKPVAGYYIVAGADHGPDGSNTIIIDDQTENVSDENGRFTLRRVPVGDVVLRGTPRDMMARDRGRLDLPRTISGTGTVDLGDISLLRPRVQPGDPVGVLGFRVTPPYPSELKILAIDPGGPAASTGLQVGDVITTCDGFDVTGPRSGNWWTLVTAPPGTTLTFGTRRGVTATVVLGRGSAAAP